METESRSQKIAVTGATGRVGSHLLDDAQAELIVVRCLEIDEQGVGSNFTNSLWA